MSPELIGTLSVGVALGGLVLALRSHTDRRLEAFGSEPRQVVERVVRLDGLIEGSGLFHAANGAAPGRLTGPGLSALALEK